MTRTRAFAVIAACIVGNAARMRASLLTTPPCMGTFKSSRISTRLSRRSRLDIFVIFKNGSQAAFDHANVVSSMRLENPHSLSYQAHTFTSVPSITLVSVAS